MRFIIYIFIALGVAFEALGQGKTEIENSQQNRTEQVVPFGVTEEAAEPNIIATEAEPDVFPQMNGGPTDFLIYVQNNMRYPDAALAAGVQGKVMVIATVAADGTVHEAEILKGIREDIDAEALRLVEEMPAWHPAEKNGQKVATKAVVVVPFKIKKDPEPFK